MPALSFSAVADALNPLCPCSARGLSALCPWAERGVYEEDVSAG
jgi:hypothetical protein